MREAICEWEGGEGWRERVRESSILLIIVVLCVYVCVCVCVHV